MGADITLSIEVELAWGIHDTGDLSTLSTDRAAETKALERLLDYCDELNIPISFDIVGHLLLDECDGVHESPHPETWFAADPGTSRNDDPLFYAADLIERICESDIDHEICTHTFSHTLFDQSSVPIVEWELEQVEAVHEAFGLDTPTTLVAPRHQSPPKDVLKEYGYEVIRTPDPNYTEPDPLITSVGVLQREHPLTQPREVDGIIETYCTPYESLTAPYLPNGQREVDFPLSAIPSSIRRRLKRRYLTDVTERAIQTDSFLHLWTHLFNLANESQLETTLTYLDQIAAHRETGDVSLTKMNEIPDRMNL